MDICRAPELCRYHGDEANKMRKRVANYGKGTANNVALKEATKLRTSPLDKKSKIKGGGTSKLLYTL